MQQVEKTQLQCRLEELDDKAMTIYESIKDQYEPQYNGKFLTIDVESKRVIMNETLDEAMDVWQKERQPDQMFFILKIGDIFLGQMFALAARA